MAGFSGPCMCGDTCCPSCGPAQGNFKCGACGVWASDGGCADPVACAVQNLKNDEAEFAAYAEMDRLEAEAVALGRIPDQNGHWHTPR